MSNTEKTSIEEKKAIIGAYYFLLREINAGCPDVEISEEQQIHSFNEASYDFDRHNRTIGFHVRTTDLIKCISFLGCHLLAWLPTVEQQNAVISSLVRCLDSVATSYRDDEKGLAPDHINHIARLVQLEAHCIHNKPIGDIWGHGFWRVGLYMSFLSAAKGGVV